jgi:membrane protease YdiL (CAAX protease family)
MRSLRAAPLETVARLRDRLWWRAIATQWSLTGIVLIVWFANERPLSPLGLELRPTAGLAGVLVGLATMASLVWRQRASLAHDEALRAQVRARLAPVERLLPRSRAELPRFALLCVTAGVCEELLFRGYLYWYAAQFMPPIAAAVLQAVVFGVGHLYQGRRGVLLTGLAGLFFTAVLLVSGSIWPAMLMHALMDLNAGDLALRVPPSEPAAKPVPETGEPT